MKHWSGLARLWRALDDEERGTQNWKMKTMRIGLRARPGRACGDHRSEWSTALPQGTGQIAHLGVVGRQVDVEPLPDLAGAIGGLVPGTQEGAEGGQG